MSPREARLVLPEPDPELYREANELAAKASAPAVAGNVAFGTAGWTDKTLVQGGLFYPKGVTSAEGRLRHYAHHFALVEVDATYYTLMPPDVSAHWVQWTPAGFVLDVKAHPIVTGHPIDTERLPPDLREALELRGKTGRVYPDRMPREIAGEIERRFVDFLQPLQASGRLGALMAQFPPWFTATRGNARELERLRERFPELPIAIELRHRSWLLPERRERVFDLFERAGFSYVCVDEPDVEPGGLPPIVRVTNPELAIVRFHGHNRAGWTKRGASVHERFDYLYGNAELARWVEPVRELSRDAKRVHAIFNNCVRNYAVLGAKGLSVLLTA